MDFLGVYFNDAMQQGVGDAPFLALGDEGDGLVVEAFDGAAALLVITVEEADHVTDRDFVATKGSEAQPNGKPR